MNTLLLITMLWLNPPDTLNLKQCYAQTFEVYPLKNQKEMLMQSNQIEQENINNIFKPQLSLNASASYVSEVPTLPLELPPTSNFNLNIEEPPQDRYQVTLDAQQLIYDGGITKQRIQAKQTELGLQEQKIEVELYQLKTQINQLYFVILLAQEKESILQIAKENLESNLKTIESGVENGVLLPSDASVLRAEIIKIEQEIVSIQSDRKAALATLSEWMETDLEEDIYFQIPEKDAISTPEERPEFELFEQQRLSLQANESIVASQNKPKVSAFAQAGYGRPGLNFLSNEFSPFFQAGINFSWKFWDWKQSKRQQQVLQIQREIVSNQEEVFEKNLSVQKERFFYEIEKLEQLIEKDEEIISLREKVTQTAASQMKNGVLTPTQYLIELNAEIQAKIQKQTRVVQLSKVRIDYQTLTGENYNNNK